MRRSVNWWRHVRLLVAGALLAAGPVVAATSGRIARYRLAGHDLRFRDVAVLTDGGIVTVGSSRADTAPDTMDAIVADLGSDGQLERVRTFDMGGSAEFLGVAATSDGGWVAAGSAPGAGGAKTAWILRADATGAPTWSRLLSSAPTSELQDVVVTDSGIVVVGIKDRALLIPDPALEHSRPRMSTEGARATESVSRASPACRHLRGPLRTDSRLRATASRLRRHPTRPLRPTAPA